MILFFLEYLQQTLHWKVPHVFEYTSTRMLLSALTSLICCISLGPLFIRILYNLKMGQPIRKQYVEKLYELHAKKKDTPTMGGLLILFSMIVSLFLWMDLRHVFTLILLATTLVLGAVGAVDDYLKLKASSTKGLSKRWKFFLQCSFAGLIALYFLSPTVAEWVHTGSFFAPPQVRQPLPGGGEKSLALQEIASYIYVPFFKDSVFQFTGVLAILLFLFYIVVITGSSNAVNLTDGLDGLAAGCLLMVAFCLASIAFMSNNLEFSRYLHILYIEGSSEIAIYLSAMMGACLGFLWYNAHPAEVFMGDTGSLALGGVVGVAALLLKREFLLALVGGVFVAEAVSVIIQVTSFRMWGKRVFLCTPLHHHFEYKDWPETKVVIRFWIVGLVLSLLGIASLKFQ